MIIHHPDRGTFHSIETLITRQVGQFWKAHPGKFSKAPKGLSGSVGYELASGLPAVGTDGDLDLLLFAQKRIPITEAQKLWSMINSAPGKINALIERPCCGLSLEEFVTASPHKILLRTGDGSVLGSNPWNISSGEDN
jgi:phosphoribosyl-dephospho-CoA transferase